MNQDLPMMASSAYATSSISINNLFQPNQILGAGYDSPTNAVIAYRNDLHRAAAIVQRNQPTQGTIMAEKNVRRIVQVFIMDPNENVPLDKAMLYQSEQKLTDLTDQELFFEIDIKGILEAHNKYRVTLVDKKVKDRTENLEPIRVRELKMVVTNVASF